MRSHILNECLKSQDIGYREFNSKLTPDNTYAMIGVRMPIIHKMIKQIMKDDPF